MNKSLLSNSNTIVSAEDIASRVGELARQIDHDYQNYDQLLLLGILRGAFIFLADLARQLQTPHVVDFMALTSYSKDKALGEVRILMDSREIIKDQHVLIVEDILDRGNTLKHLYHTIQDRKPASLRSCVLVRKKRPDLHLSFPLDYVGFDIPDVWVVGYGLDYDNLYRTLPYIAELKMSETDKM
ncbi:MAG TPA: hypoxanthine phosphoribosyltransferase [Anaerolineales bacterium]|nr:hypoxanthine phosphoribosyltransferase [Anaerolineales bacterium]